MRPGVELVEIVNVEQPAAVLDDVPAGGPFEE